MPLKKPPRRTRKPRNKKRVLVVASENRAAASALLTKASQSAVYKGSPYHRVRGSKMGASADRQWPDASKCDPNLTRETATRVLRAAIRDGQVSAAWRDGFPRMVWAMIDGVLYEARLSNSTQGEYHAYPLEDQREWPNVFRRNRLTSP